MGLGYTKWSAEDDKSRNVIPDGEYRVYVANMTIKKSKQKYDKDNNPLPVQAMAELDIVLYDNNGRERQMKDWVMLEGEMSWKFRHLCDAVGALDKYELDEVGEADIINKYPIAKVKSKLGKDKDNNEVMRNNIVDYLRPVGQGEQAADPSLNDDIGF